MSKIIKKVNNIDSIETIVHSTINDIQHDEDYTLVGWVKGNTINNSQKIINRINFLETENKNLKSQISSPNNKILGRFTTTELMSILSSVSLGDRIERLFNSFEDLDKDAFNEFKKCDLYNANGLDLFYALFSFLSLGIPNQFFNADDLEDYAMAIILACSGILISCGLIEKTNNNDIIITDIAKKFYVQLLLNNYTPSIDLTSSLFDLADLY